MFSKSYLDMSTETIKKSVIASLQNSFDFRVFTIIQGNSTSYIENFLINGLDVDSIDESTDETLLVLALRIGNLRLL